MISKNTTHIFYECILYKHLSHSNFYNDKNGGIYLNWEDFVGTLQVEASSGDGCQNWSHLVRQFSDLLYSNQPRQCASCFPSSWQMLSSRCRNQLSEYVHASFVPPSGQLQCSLYSKHPSQLHNVPSIRSSHIHSFDIFGHKPHTIHKPTTKCLERFAVLHAYCRSQRSTQLCWWTGKAYVVWSITAKPLKKAQHIHQKIRNIF